MKTVISSRRFPVPVALLFDAWTRPVHLENWWGPNGFTNSFHEFDLREGGFWRFTMHGPDGKNYENECRFISIVPCEEIVFEHISEPKFLTSVQFKSKGVDLSSLQWNMTFKNDKVFEALKDFVAEKNEENLNRLEAELKRMEF